MKKSILALAAFALVVAACDPTSNEIETPPPGPEGPGTEKVYTPESISISPKGPVDLLTGETLALTATILPEEAAGASVSWSLNPASGVATIAPDGTKCTLTATGAGTVEVTATAGGKSDKVSVTVKEPQKPIEGIHANYEDFLGRWKVTGTEHEWFKDWGSDGDHGIHTYSYDIQIVPDMDGESYRIYNWETPASEDDATYMYYGGYKEDLPIYRYLQEKVRIKDVDVRAWYDSDRGQMHIDRQTFYNSGSKTIEFLGDSVDPDGHMSLCSFISTPGDADIQYTICDFIMTEDGTVWITRTSLEGKKYPGLGDYMAFMGYARGEGFPWSLHFNAKFAFPFSMSLIQKVWQPQSITLSPETLTLKVGETSALNAQVLPADAMDPNVYWYSDDSYIASVSREGQVTAKKAGETTITAYTVNGLEAKCKVTVLP